MKLSKYTNIDEYVSNFSDDTREKLQEIRATIRELAPEAEERISYGIPAFFLDKTPLVYFAGYENHLSIYPIPEINDEEFEKEVGRYKAGKGTLRFPLDTPLPIPFIQQIVKGHVARIEARRKK